MSQYIDHKSSAVAPENRHLLPTSTGFQWPKYTVTVVFSKGKGIRKISTRVCPVDNGFYYYFLFLRGAFLKCLSMLFGNRLCGIC